MSSAAFARPVPAEPDAAYKVEVVSDYLSFVKLESRWNSVVEESGIDHPFLRHEWIRTWWECFGTGKELHILLVTNGGRTIAIAPLMLSCTRMYGLKIRQLEFIYNEHTPRFDFIVAVRPNEAYQAIWRYLTHRNELWEVLKLSQLSAGSRTLTALPPLAEQSGYLTGCWRSDDSPYLPLSGTWESYFEERDRKHRSNMRNRLNRLNRLGEVDLQIISEGMVVEGALEEGLKIEAKAWKGDSGTAILCRPDSCRFYRTLALRAAEQGWLRLYFLAVNGQRVAFDYSLCYKSKLYILKPGYDPQFYCYSPYNSLCYLKLRDAFEHGLIEYDFLGAKEGWKLDWTREVRPHYWLFIFRNSLRSNLLHYAKFRVCPELKRNRFVSVVCNAVLDHRRA